VYYVTVIVSVWFTTKMFHKMTLTEYYGSSVLCITLSKGEINSCMITNIWYIFKIDLN